jgi:hypothetical protein
MNPQKKKKKKERRRRMQCFSDMVHVVKKNLKFPHLSYCWFIFFGFLFLPVSIEFFSFPPSPSLKFPPPCGSPSPPPVRFRSPNVDATEGMLAVWPCRCHLPSCHPLSHGRCGNCVPVPLLFRYRDDAVRPLPFVALGGCGGAHVREGLIPISSA